VAEQKALVAEQKRIAADDAQKKKKKGKEGKKEREIEPIIRSTPASDENLNLKFLVVVHRMAVMG
jgi:hypothetical protein